MRIILLLAIFLIATQSVYAQEHVLLGPCYSLPKDGVWTEYSWKQTHPVKRTGTLRISAVGTVQRDGKTFRWVEIKLTANDKGKKFRRIRKILIDEAAYKKGQPWKDRIAECWEQTNDQDVVKVAPKRSVHFPDLGLESKKQQLQLMKKKSLATKVGKLNVDFYHTRGTYKRMLRHVWLSLSDQVPFGLAEFELIDLSGITPFSLLLKLEITKKGRGAQSELKVTSK